MTERSVVKQGNAATAPR